MAIEAEIGIETGHADVHERLAEPVVGIGAPEPGLVPHRIGQLDDTKELSDTIAALGKLNNTVKAREVLAEARNLLGGNGILLANHVIRHMADIEAIYTFEGTETIQTLLVGRDITGLSAFT